MRTLDPTLRGGLLDSPAPSSGQPNPLGGLLGDMNRLQKASLATTLLPVIPDVLGAAGDLQMYAQKPETRTPLNYGLSALGLLPFIGGATAFHGSPHVFDKFDMTKIGTGEGAQAYGHGLYFAESPEVAGTYRQAPGYNPIWQSYDIPSTADDRLYDLEAAADNASDNLAGWGIGELRVGDFSPEYIRKQIIELAGDEGIDATQSLARFDSAVKELDNYQGYLYTVDIPDEAIAKMADFDVPISQQSKQVREAIMATKAKLTPDDIENLGGPEGIKLLYGPDVTVEEFLGTWQSLRGAPDAGEKLLFEAGIPGIKYLDQGSRAAGEGTRNFVVFDDALPKIIKREQ